MSDRTKFYWIILTLKVEKITGLVHGEVTICCPVKDHWNENVSIQNINDLQGKNYTDEFTTTTTTTKLTL